MSSDSAWLVALERLENTKICGAKAYNLGQLIRAGHTVPRGFVLVDAAMQRHLKDSGVVNRCRDLLVELPRLKADEIGRQASSIRNRILKTPLCADLRDDITRHHREMWNGKRIAVRSSAICEDDNHASFAGQLDSVLGVESFEDFQVAIRTVWASLWSDRCLLYARRQRFVNSRMGVIVQEMVDALYSGIAFSQHPCPTTTPDEIVIEYVGGLGASLAAGRQIPNRVRLCRGNLALIREETTAQESRTAMPGSMLREIAQLALNLEGHFGRPQDVEWSVDPAGLIMLLQTRPITVAGAKDLVLWSNANIAENFPALVSPFLSSIVSKGYTAYFRGLGLAFGISRRRIAAMEEALQNIVGLHTGRLYYNLTNIHALINLAPGGPWLIRSFNEFTGAREFPRTAVLNSGAMRRATEFARVVAKTTWQYLTIERRVTRFERTIDQYAARTLPDVVAKQSPRELCGLIRDFLAIRLHHWNNAALADVAAMVCYRLLRLFLLHRLGSGNELCLHNDLLKGLPDLASTRPARELWRLSRVIRNDLALFKLFEKYSGGEVLARLDETQWSDFRDQFDRYLSEWGFRYSGELMLTSLTPQENPEPIIRLLQTYAQMVGPGPEGIWAEQLLGRLHLTKIIAEQLTPSGWWRWFPLCRAGQFRLLLRATQGAIRFRERARMKQALLYTRLRHIMLSAGNILERKGQLETRDQVFYLVVDEVLSLLGGTAMVPGAMKQTAKLRQEELSRFTAACPPDSFQLPWGEQWSVDTMRGTSEHFPSELQLQGTGACGGLADGPAAVVLDVTEADRLRGGEILVTRQTDPGWATVFLLIKGLVVERGGMLSHGAIIAREYGIPTVVGVSEATQRIRCGDRLRLNGDSGLVELYQ